MRKQLLSLTLIAQLACAQDLTDTKKLEEPLQKASQENATTPTLDWIKSLDKDFKRDFYINQFLQTNITSQEAQEALDLASNVNIPMFLNFAKRFEHDETRAVATCLSMNIEELKNSYADCIAAGLSLDEATKLNSIDLDLIRQKVAFKYPTLDKKLKVITAAIPFTKLIISKSDILVDIYLNVNDDFRSQYFNYKLPKRTISKINSNYENKMKFIEKTVLSKDLKKVQNSLTKLDSNDLDFDTTFLLAINAINLEKKDLASKYLSLALRKENITQESLDKVHFWKYLLLKNKQDLDNVANSNDINFYSLLAKQLLNKRFDLNIKKDSFIRPYKKLFKSLNSKEKAFYYSIAKTKSNFDEKALTKDKKLGVFALDIKTIKEITKELNLPFDISKQFFISDNFLYFKKHEKSIQENTALLKLLKMDNIEFASLKEENTFLKKLLVLEKILYKKDIYKKFIVNYYLYYELLKKKGEENIKFSSIFGKINLLDQTLDEKALN